MAIEQDTSPSYIYDSVCQNLALELLNVPVDEVHEADIVEDGPGFGVVMDRRLPLGPGFMEISLGDTDWFNETV